MVTVNKLKGKIIERGLNIAGLAAKIGINKATLYRKLNNNGDTITIKEANLIVDVLNLSREEAIAIFFSQYVA